MALGCLARPTALDLPPDRPDRPIPHPAALGAKHLVEELIAQAFSVDVADLRRPTRGLKHIAFARQIAMYLTHVGCGLSLTEVGALFGRDRTTVAHACSIVEDRRDDAEFDGVLRLLEAAVRLGRRTMLARPVA